MNSPKPNPDIQKKIEELQILEHSLQSSLQQKQSVQLELNEVQTALGEVKKTNDEIYKTLGQVMIKANKQDLIKELEEKQKVSNLRVSTMEKQEKLLEEKLNTLREDLTKIIKDDADKK